MLRVSLSILSCAILFTSVGADDRLGFKQPPGKPNLPNINSQRDAKIKAEVEAILQLQKEGKSAEAAQLTAKLVAEHPTLVPAEMLGTIVIRDRTTKTDKEIRDAKASAFNNQMASVDRSATPESGNITYPPGWKEQMAKREAAQRAKLVPRTKQENELLKWLDQPVGVPISFKNLPLQQALKMLEQAGINITINKRTLDELRLDYSTPVTLNVGSGASRGTALTQFLDALGMTFIIKNEQITVMSKEEASNLLVTRIFPVSGMVGGPGGATAEGVIRFIQETVEPDSWKPNGGPGTITYYPGANILLVRNSAAVISVLEQRYYGKK